MKTDEFRRAWRAALPGTLIVYHVGLLVLDKRLDLDGETYRLASLVWRLGCPRTVLLVGGGEAEYGQGLGILTQRRVGPGECEYRIRKL